MSKVLLFSYAQTNSDNLKNLLEKHYVDVQITRDKKSTESYLRYESPQLLIIEKNIFENNDLLYITDLRQKKFDRPILFLTSEFKNFDPILEKHRIHFLTTPVVNKELLNLTKKLLSAPSSIPQRHARHNTDINFDIESMADGEVTSSKMTNLSKGGLYCVFEDDPKFSKGDLVRINIPLNELNTTRSMTGKIIWKTKKSLSNPNPGLGIQFINAQEMYSSLMQEF